jgi:Holliday junction resolvase RusA-like endonuclease
MITTNAIQFTVYAKAQPQGSSKAFVVKGRAIVTSDNKKLKPYRQELTHTAMAMLAERGIEAPFAAKHVPVRLDINFYLERPPSVPKRRSRMVVKPDISKLVRATEDSLTGLLYADDAQIIGGSQFKHYGSPERVEILVQILE